MINFRYHLVSLIAVFLALAVGLVLGAGPLKGPVSDELSSQVSQLRDRNDQLREEASKASQSARERDDYLVQSAGQLVGGLLTGQAIAIVSLGGVSGGQRDAVMARLGEAGATQAADVRITSAWWGQDPSQAFAAALADLASKVSGTAPPTDQDTAAAVASALATALAGTEAERREGATMQPSAQAKATLDVLRAHKLITGTADLRATAIVMLTEQLDSAKQGATSDPADLAEGQTGVLITGQFAATGAPTLIAGPATWSGDTVTLARQNDGVKEKVATVDNADEVTGQLSVPRALAGLFHGVVGHYGIAPSATGPVTGETTSASSLVPPYLPVSPPVPSANGRAAQGGS